MPDPAGSAPMSLAADRLLVALDATVGGGAVVPGRWLVALAAHDRSLAEDAAGTPGLTAALEDAASAGGTGVLTRAELEVLASSRATGAGRVVASPGDVAGAIVDAQESVASTIPVPTAAESGPSPLLRPTAEPAGRRTSDVAASRPRTFRLFVSSTFDDFELERDVLREQVWPRLQRFCEQRGARFQAVDLRWGVTSEAASDQQTLNICLGEIERCHQVTPRPNFLVLVGEHYGWEPLPPQIPADEFDQLMDGLSGARERALALEWFETDVNAVPPVRRLRARTGQFADDVTWRDVVESPLHRALARAAVTTGLGPERMRAYVTSATEQEIVAGALEADDPEQVVCVLRHLESASPTDELLAADDQELAHFVDADQAPLGDLWRRLRERLGDRMVRPPRAEPGAAFMVTWGDREGGLTYLADLVDGVAEMLEASVDAELRDPRRSAGRLRRARRPMPAPDGLDAEGWAHHEFAEERTDVFVGRGAELGTIERYLAADVARPLVITGAGGTGKSALVAEAVRWALERRPDDVVVYRFVGATPASSDVRSLLGGICRELARRAGGSELDVPSDFQELVADFWTRLEPPPAGRVTVIIDSLDQLNATEGARDLAWVPAALPAGARVVLSTRPGDTLHPLEGRAERLVLGPLAAAEGRQALDQLLGGVHRTLQDDQYEEVERAFVRSGGNPLFLRLAYEEARRWAFDPDHPDRAHPPLAVAREDTDGVVEPIIRENLFRRLCREHGDLFTTRALGYLGASRFGLTETELLGLLSADREVYRSFLLSSFHLPPDLVALTAGALDVGELSADCETPGVDTRRWLEAAIAGARDGSDSSRLDALLDRLLGRPDGPSLPVVLWSRLSFDLEPYLTERQVDEVLVLDFYHRELRDVAAAEFAQGEPGRVLHDRLARYFQLRADPEGDHTWETPDGRIDARGLSELPFHLVSAQRWDDVVETLTDFSFLEHKATHVGVVPRGGPDQEGLLHTGVFRLQDDFDLALDRMSEGEGGVGEEHRVRPVVTAVDLGEGLVVRCPHCNTWHPFREQWRGQEVDCPNPDCGAPLKVNPFVCEPT